MSIFSKLIASGALAFVTMSAHAYCSAKVDTVRVVAESAPLSLKERFKYATGEELADMTGHKWTPYSPVYGATQAQWSTLVSVTDFAVGKTAEGQPCVAIKAAKIRISFNPLEVFVGDFLRNYACMREHVVTHEYLHVEMYRRQLKDSLTPIAQGVHEDLKRFNGLPLKRKSEAEDVALDHLSALARKHLLVYRDGPVKAEQATIDVPINFADHRTVCGGESQIIEAGLVGR